MKRITWNRLSTQQQNDVLRRPNNVAKNVQDIVQRVQREGDQALLEMTERFDGVRLTQLVQSTACDVKQNDFYDALLNAMRNITTVHAAQQTQPLWVTVQPGVSYQRITRPIERVGLYVPGGSAPLISTLLMLAVPARLAGCRNIVVCTPPPVDPRLCIAAQLCGIDRVYTIGGAQAIAAMAYGTESVPKVDKIFGPGNSWVTAAKQWVANDLAGAAIDLPAGPSEVVVIADQLANPAYVAADLLAQAEHGPDSQVLLLTPCEAFAQRVQSAITTQLTGLSRRDIIEQSLRGSSVILTESIAEAIAISNQYAPEHLILQCETPEQWLDDINNAGAVFLGPWTPETLGDYVLGSNHVLPTGGSARAYSGLSVTDFMKTISVQHATQTGLIGLANAAQQLAKIEGLDAHAQAVMTRLAKEVSND